MLTQALVFDWGNTLMRVFPEYTGSMAAWPHVEAIPGSAQALQFLKGNYQIALASNAVDSDADQVKAALQRVGLSEYFDRIFTPGDLNGQRKPQLNFFHYLENAMNLSSQQMIMVGDDYKTDILGAVNAGWQAIWYNPTAAACPGLAPMHAAEIQHLSKLSDVLKYPPLPDLTTCWMWLAENNYSTTLLLHVLGVAAIAYQMALWLRQRGLDLDPVLAHRGGLLHDLAKLLPPANPLEDHGARAAGLLISRGQPALAEVARRHVMHSILAGGAYPETWEQKIVFFADKLVEGSRLVELDERMRGLSQRYPSQIPTYQDSLLALKDMQEDFSHRMGFPSAELVPRLKQAMLGSNPD